ncbi:MAG: amino acid permease [Thermoplasmataceae archaeon]
MLNNSERADESRELKRNLSFRDVFFLSFGGMSPLLSILTYGAVALAFGGLLTPVVMIIGTGLVLINGLVVMMLSRRFQTSGGYYTYAFHALTERVGLSTGWMYLFYSILFGIAYLMGAVFVVVTIFGLSPLLTMLAIIIPASFFLVAGIKPSAKYAIYTGIIEIGIIISIVLISFIITKGVFYVPSPIKYHISGGNLALGILFAMGIPTGYGSIAPISGEVKNPEKSVGKAVISVILTGGILATVFLYSIVNLLNQTGAIIPGSTSGIPIVGIISHDFSSYGPYLLIAIVLASINDGILALLSFGSAASRTIFRMGLDRSFPSFFSLKKKDNPIVASATVASIILIVPILMIHYVPAETAFIIVGTIASLSGLFIHITAGFSLIRVGTRKGKRLLLRGAKNLRNVIFDYNEVILAGIASIITTVELIYSAYSTMLAYSVIFLVWIVLGYIIVDIKDVVSKTPYSTKLGKDDRILVSRLKDLTSLKIRTSLPDVFVQLEDTLQKAMINCISLDAQGAIVIDKLGKPVGTLILRDIFLLAEQDLTRMQVKNLWLERLVTIKSDTGIADIIKIFKETKVPILCIVDNYGKSIGTVREKEVLMALSIDDDVKKDAQHSAA